MLKKKLTADHKRFQRERAGMEFNLRVHQFINNFKSKEEPTVKLNRGEMIEQLSHIVTSAIPNLKNKKSW